MRKLVIAALVVLAGVMAFAVHRLVNLGPETVEVAVEPGPAQPSVSLDEAGIDAGAMEVALDYARARNTQALVVAHGGHVVFEHYAAGMSRDSPVRFDEMAPVLATLLLGTALNDRLVLDIDFPLTRYLGEGADGSRTIRSLLSAEVGSAEGEQNTELLASLLEKVTQRPYQALAVERLWKPLGNGGLLFEKRNSAPRQGEVSASCCLTARVGDWLRVGQMLVRDGVFEANQYTPPGFVAAMIRPTYTDSTHGYFVRVDGSFAAKGVAWVGGKGHQRLWLIPSLDLVILRLGGDPPPAAGWDEAMIPDSIVRGTRGWQPASGGEGTDPRKYAPH
jgi:CubicO group peptidase (beta-lactamase class C family)